MSTVAVRRAAEYEERLARYLFERSEESRAVRVGEKETSEQAAIVARYGDLFTTGQLDGLREEELEATGDERERLYRLRKTCEDGVVVAALAERLDALENALLAERIDWRGEELPLRSAQARLAVLPEYADRDELGALQVEASARFNPERRELLAAGESLAAQLFGRARPGRAARGGEVDLAARARERPLADARVGDRRLGAAPRPLARAPARRGSRGRS